MHPAVHLRETWGAQDRTRVDVPETELRLALRGPGGLSVISRLADVDVLCVQS